MKRLNPKSHDSLFKWLITSFTREFFAHYFPAVRIGEYSFLDKEFLSKYEALQESLKGDLFLLMEVEIDGEFQEVAIQIEHQSEREEVAKRLFEYLCYVWLLKQKPVWSIVIYTDEAQWRKPVADHFCYSFSSAIHQQYFHFDVIKVNRENSRELIKKHSLLCNSPYALDNGQACLKNVGRWSLEFIPSLARNKCRTPTATARNKCRTPTAGLFDTLRKVSV